MGRSAERRLGVDDPVLAKQGAQECGEALRLVQMLEWATEIELASAKGSPQTGDKLTPKNTTQDLDRQKERIARSDPARVIGRQTSGRDGAVQVRMVASAPTIP